MRRLAVMASLGAMTLAAAACGGSSSSGAASSAPAPATSAATTGPVKIALIVKAPIDYFNAMTDAVKAWASTHGDVQITYGAGKTTDDSAGQIDLINAAVTNGLKGIAITPAGPAVQPALEKAVAAGVKVVLLDNDLPDMKDKTSVVSTDNFKAAQAAGTFLNTVVKPGEQIGVLSGVPGVPALDARVDGMKKTLDPGVKVAASLPTNCDQQKGVTAVTDMLQAHPDIIAIYAACGPPALAADQVLKQKNMLAKVKVVGFDALPDEAKSILAGEETATVAQFPGKMGVMGVQTLLDAIAGKAVPANVDTGSQLVDKSSADKFTTFQ